MQIETLALDGGAFRHLDAHLARMARSAAPVRPASGLPRKATVPLCGKSCRIVFVLPLL
jgi:hypothetical protein